MITKGIAAMVILDFMFVQRQRLGGAACSNSLVVALATKVLSLPPPPLSHTGGWMGIGMLTPLCGRAAGRRIFVTQQ